MKEIDEGIARRVLEVVDAGLVAGLGEPVPGQMCVEAAVCYALGLPHSDEPPCVAPAVRQLKIRLNDARWSSPQARARGLRRLAVASLGSAGTLDEVEFVNRVARLAIQTCVPTALRVVAQRHSGVKRERLLQVAELCEREPTREHALKARDAAYAAANAAYADAAAHLDAARAIAARAADAVVHAAYAAAYADAAGAAKAVADATAYAHAADAYYAGVAGNAAASAHAAAYSYAYYAYAAFADGAINVALSDAAARSAYENELTAFAERVVQVLIDMGSPGCAFLHLTTYAEAA